MKKLDELVTEMRTMGEQMIPYTYPMTDRALENYVASVRIKEAIVDGYHIMIHYNKSDYKTHFLETVQVYGKFIPFLPFNLAIKIAKKFLGRHNLFLVEQLRSGSKIYCWSVFLDREGKSKPPADDSQVLKYEDFNYAYLNSAQADFF